MSTDKQTNRQNNQRYQKHNLLCQGGNKYRQNMLSTDKQTNRQNNQRYQKHNLLCQGGNKYRQNMFKHTYSNISEVMY